MRKINRYFLPCTIFFLALFLVSCAELTPPTPVDIIKHPLGTGPLYKGMNKTEVVNLWGEPNVVNKLQQEKWSAPREEWIDYARYPGVGVDVSYLGKTKYLYFEGDALVSWKSEEESQE